MNIHSNVPFPREAIRWKDGQWALFVNHQDNGVQPEETAGSRYTADFTITKELSAVAAIEAFTRQLQDPQLDQAVIDNAEVTGVPAIDVTAEYTTKAPVSIFPPLPASGSLKKGEIYSYGGGAVMVVQDHQRTIYTPEDDPGIVLVLQGGSRREQLGRPGRRCCSECYPHIWRQDMEVHPGS